MSNLNRPARLNRTLLGLWGLVLFAAGGFVVVTHLGMLALLDSAAPSTAGTALPPTWVWYAVAAAAVVLGLLLPRWLAAQLARKPKTQTWRFERDPAGGRTELAAGAAVAPFMVEVETYPGVHAAHATLAGGRDAPVLVLVLTAEQEGDISEIRHLLETHSLPRLQQALDLEVLVVTIEFRFSANGGARTR
ncbi:alkaline shock response membrane anchor protein AmaP [Amycolatopsis sp. NPDC004378]